MSFRVALIRMAMMAMALVAAQAACAGGESSLFAGKQIRFFTMGGPGGGYDTYMRVLIPPLEKRLGAKILPINETGAGGLIAMNRVVTAPPDGLTLVLIGGEALVTAPLYGLPGVNYDLRTLTWIARVSAEAKVVLFSAKTEFKTLADMLASPRPIIWGGTGKSDGNSDFSAILAHATGMKTKIVLGYAGSGGMNIAIENGEADGRVVSDESAALFAKDGRFRVMTVLARNRGEQFPDAPTIFEGAKLTPEGAKMIEWRADIAALGRLIVSTPGVPADKVAALRSAFAGALHDPETIAEIKRRSLSPGFASGEEVDAMVKNALTMLDEPALAEVRKVVLEKYY
ncbi:tripartite tricarboxylate transporter substrate-binding protein [Roseiarcaceae bacterium H3SJ34-1]|uniref:tripartite tricarboxylate transporter substrate-binding protein n=1 Tax=Terripilifer ovatus TaxID=3032367 RepID=UPI003AB969C2|nr:tripartite tricarboxylate transporter substrate-binding protein [Roseiarcaceae bacterium H3SJ34-1]